jgi:carboxyl-terminal processing protease
MGTKMTSGRGGRTNPGIRQLTCGLLLLLVASSVGRAAAQSLSLDRGRGREMLKVIESDVRKLYYDPSFKGVDLEARFREARSQLDQAQSLGEILAIVAQPLLDLDDPHTRFVPPMRNRRYEYGWEMRVVGDACLVSSVKPGSDAEKKGLRPGDRVTSVAGFAPDPGNLWKIQHVMYSLWPQSMISVVAQAPEGTAPRELEVAAHVRSLQHQYDLTDPEGQDYWELVRNGEREARPRVHRYMEVGDDVLLWKMPGFDLREDDLKLLMKKARKRKALVVDMRGNGGGSVKMLQDMIGRVFDREVRVAELRNRKGKKPLLAKTSGKDAYAGVIVALVDTGSASAAEVFARVLQMEQRGRVLGEPTSGSVMQAEYRPYTLGAAEQIYYGAFITTDDLVMADGMSLERRGVVPDERVQPTAQDLRAGRDPALARALEIAGYPITAEDAGQLFPVEWEK